MVYQMGQRWLEQDNVENLKIAGLDKKYISTCESPHPSTYDGVTASHFRHSLQHAQNTLHILESTRVIAYQLVVGCTHGLH
ncbi:hypothetical protein TNCV_3035181 [Trichonephila clavipes]|nr:hypothetical protein TNCV_3035181 [Trichonephila clavipes]